MSASTTQIGGTHYTKLAIQPLEYALKNNLNAAQAKAIKYVTRYKDKDGIKDLRKAIHCIELLIQHEEEQAATTCLASIKDTLSMCKNGPITNCSGSAKTPEMPEGCSEPGHTL